MKRPSPTDLLVVALTALVSGCAIKISLDNPYTYRPLSPAERLPVPCVFHVSSPAPGTLLEEDGYEVDMARAVSGQLRAALLGFCRGARESSEAPEAILAAAKGPLLVLDISMRGGLSASAITWGMNSGWADGTAVIRGTAQPKAAKSIDFGANGQRRTYYAEAGVGAEGLRNALGQAVQGLVDDMAKQRSELLAMAGGTAEPPAAQASSK